MELPTITSYNGYDIVMMEGNIRVSLLPSLSPYLLSHMQNNPGRDIVFDMSNVTSVDSSTLRLIINFKKRLELNKLNLYILKPSNEITNLLQEVNLDKILTILTSTEDLQKQISAGMYAAILPHTHDEDGKLRLHCTCPICGSRHVAGYLIDPQLYKWSWAEDDFFPISTDQDGNEIDVFAMMPIVCTDCYMCSIEFSDFNIAEGETIAQKSMLDENTKVLLSKSIKKRKKMMELDITVGDRFFMLPRDRRSSLHAFLLAETCARTMALNRSGANPFKIGFMNYLALKYADNNIKGELINNCRTWLTQALSDHVVASQNQLSQSYYILLMASLNVQKTKEAARLYSEFSVLMNKTSMNQFGRTIEDPAFWFTKAQSIWQKEIQSRSSVMKL